MADPMRQNSTAQPSADVLLADQFAEGLRPVAARDDDIFAGFRLRSRVRSENVVWHGVSVSGPRAAHAVSGVRRRIVKRDYAYLTCGLGAALDERPAAQRDDCLWL